MRLVRELTATFSPDTMRYTAEAMMALQDSTEDFMVHLLGDTNLCAIHAKRVTISELGGGLCFFPCFYLIFPSLSLSQCPRTFSWRAASEGP